jgi:hypothetical protein
MKPLTEWSPDQVLKGAALVGAAIAFVVGLWQYRRAQKWKRAEWVAQEMKALFSEPLVQAALMMVDWGARTVQLFPTRDKVEDRSVFITDDDVAGALMPHDERPDGFSPLEAEIRAAFDIWLDGLERFNAYVATGLVTLADLRPYLKYWAAHICRDHSTDGTEDRLRGLCTYMQRYGYSGAYDLMERISKRKESLRMKTPTARKRQANSDSGAAVA